jgi:hypothetical protein
MTESTPAESTSTQTITIQGLSFTIPSPYSEGHVLTANEAIELNRVFGENVRNNQSQLVKAAKDKALADAKTAAEADGAEAPTEAELSADTISDLAAKIGEYAGTYTFQGKRTVRAPADPVEAETHKLAKEMITAALRQQGYDLKKITSEVMEGYVTGLIAKRPDIKDEAQRRVDLRKSLTLETLTA